MGRGGRPLPDGLIIGGDCPPAGPDADAEIAAQALARIPLKVGLTLTHLWIRNPQEEYECLQQVTKVDPEGVVFTTDCAYPDGPGVVARLTCRSDLQSGRMLHTQVGGLEIIDASGDALPETYVGSTMLSLSAAQFAELKRGGTTRHHYVQKASMDSLNYEATAELRREGAETVAVIVNDRAVEIPVIRASGEASFWIHGRAENGRVTALIMDDDRFPFLVDYAHWTESEDRPGFRVNFVKISFPDGEESGGGQSGGTMDGAMDGKMGEMERQLAEERRVDVYGIYFDYNSDHIRRESEPILEQIADLLGRNADWTLSIHGHTDNIGGDAYNTDLSGRRSEAVRKALVDRYGIESGRLTTAGHGASAPKDSNDTPEGRARNRRVELIRQ